MKNTLVLAYWMLRDTLLRPAIGFSFLLGFACVAYAAKDSGSSYVGLSHKVSLGLICFLAPLYVGGGILFDDRASGRIFLLLASSINRTEYVFGRYLCALACCSLICLPATTLALFYVRDPSPARLWLACVILLAMLVALAQSVAQLLLLSALVKGWSNSFLQIVIAVASTIYYVRVTYTRFGPSNSHTELLRAFKLTFITPYPIVVGAATQARLQWRDTLVSTGVTIGCCVLAALIYRLQELGSTSTFD